MNYQITIIMPALDEERNIKAAIEDVVSSFAEYSVRGEIVIINDGSTDNTGGVVLELQKKYPFLRLESNPKPTGIGSSFWKGVKVAQGEIVTLIPGDGEVLSGDVLRYVSLMEHVDILVPFVYNVEIRTWQRQLLSKVYKAVINASFGLLLNYMNGPVIYRLCILEDVELRSHGFFYQTELLIKTISRGYLFAEAPCAIRPRGHGQSKALGFNSFMTVIKGYLEMMLAVHVFDEFKNPINMRSVTYMRRQALTQSSRKAA
jgi:glycosyltransferase involved in cell wall biosynthesis